MEKLSGKTALVTGSTDGVGRLVARKLGQAGARVLVHGRDAERGARVVADIEASGGVAAFLAADLSALAEVRRLFICHPERNGPCPAVFFLMDAYGIREELKDMARRLGTVGYYVLLPNLYYRAGRDTIYGPDVQQEGSAEHTRMRAVRTKMTIPPVIDDIGAMLAFLEQQKEVKRGAVGCHGYCMSGPYALAAAARYPDRIAAAASFYGTWLVSAAEESPHLSLGKVKGELYIGCAEHDKLAPLPMVQELRTLFSRAGAAGEIELYPGVQHGFAFPQRWCYDKSAAERHWERLIAIYRRRLG
jgi:carboxymethylenebutenolidase